MHQSKNQRLWLWGELTEESLVGDRPHYPLCDLAVEINVKPKFSKHKEKAQAELEELLKNFAVDFNHRFLSLWTERYIRYFGENPPDEITNKITDIFNDFLSGKIIKEVRAQYKLGEKATENLSRSLHPDLELAKQELSEAIYPILNENKIVPKAQLEAFSALAVKGMSLENAARLLGKSKDAVKQLRQGLCRCIPSTFHFIVLESRKTS